jgi:hypothetical protein
MERSSLEEKKSLISRTLISKSEFCHFYMTEVRQFTIGLHFVQTEMICFSFDLWINMLYLLFTVAADSPPPSWDTRASTCQWQWKWIYTNLCLKPLSLPFTPKDSKWEWADRFSVHRRAKLFDPLADQNQNTSIA